MSTAEFRDQNQRQSTGSTENGDENGARTQRGSDHSPVGGANADRLSDDKLRNSTIARLLIEGHRDRRSTNSSKAPESINVIIKKHSRIESPPTATPNNQHVYSAPSTPGESEENERKCHLCPYVATDDDMLVSHYHYHQQLVPGSSVQDINGDKVPAGPTNSPLLRTLLQGQPPPSEMQHSASGLLKSLVQSINIHGGGNSANGVSGISRGGGAGVRASPWRYNQQNIYDGLFCRSAYLASTADAVSLHPQGSSLFSLETPVASKNVGRLPIKPSASAVSELQVKKEPGAMDDCYYAATNSSSQGEDLDDDGCALKREGYYTEAELEDESELRVDYETKLATNQDNTRSPSRPMKTLFNRSPNNTTMPMGNDSSISPDLQPNNDLSRKAGPGSRKRCKNNNASGESQNHGGSNHGPRNVLIPVASFVNHQNQPRKPYEIVPTTVYDGLESTLPSNRTADQATQCELLTASIAHPPNDFGWERTSEEGGAEKRRKQTPLICSFCRIAFEDEVIHSIHMGCHNHADPYICNVCGQQCSNRYGFYAHIMRGHTSNR